MTPDLPGSYAVRAEREFCVTSHLAGSVRAEREERA